MFPGIRNQNKTASTKFSSLLCILRKTTFCDDNKIKGIHVVN